jgi:alpha-D-ribose 1-methylphosphonate 5-triphosphate synthase subunit PhnL
VAEPMLSVSGLSKTITLHILHGAEVHPLRDVSFDLAPGEFLAIAGPSGAGKSSLLKCLNRTYLATAGTAMYRTAAGEVVDLCSAPERDIVALRRDEITYVSQFLKAPPRVPAVDVVASVLTRRGVAVEVARERSATMLGRLGIGPALQTSYPALFSGGEQQRVNVAKAFVDPPRLLLLDEPTSALDHENRERVIEMLREAQAAGTAVIAIFHDRELIRRLADRVLVLADGVAREVAPDDDYVSGDAVTDELMEVSR